MLFFKKKEKANEFVSIEKRFEKLFWATLPPLDNVQIYIEPNEAYALGLDQDTIWIRINTMDRKDKSVFECIDVGNMALVFKPIKQLEQFINNSDIILRKLM